MKTRALGPNDPQVPTLGLGCMGMSDLGIGFVPYSPLGRGFLTGAIRSSAPDAGALWKRT